MLVYLSYSLRSDSHTGASTALQIFSFCLFSFVLLGQNFFLDLPQNKLTRLYSLSLYCTFRIFLSKNVESLFYEINRALSTFALNGFF